MDGVRSRSTACGLRGVKLYFRRGNAGQKLPLILFILGCRRKSFLNPKPKVQSNPFHFPAISRSQSCLSKITIILFAGSGSSHCANPLLRARLISVGSGKFDFANRLNGVGEFAFCGGSRRDIAMLRHLRFPAVSPYLPARGKSPECAARRGFPF